MNLVLLTKANTKNWKDICDGAKKTVATAALIATLLFAVANLVPGDEAITAGMLIKYIETYYPELAPLLEQCPEILQRICQTANNCAK